MEIKDIKLGIEKLQEGLSILSEGLARYYLEELLAAHELLMSRYAPWKVGDKVALKYAPDYQKAPSWERYKHFLAEGATSTVRRVRCGKSAFYFDVMFDGDNNKTIFNFREDELSSVPKPPPKRFDTTYNLEYWEY